MYRKPFIDIYLENGFDFEEAKSEINFALEILFNYTYKEYTLSKTIEDWQKEKLLKIIEQRVKTRKPIQQLTGQAYFFNRKFYVNENTLIPRPETELLVQQVLNLSKQMKNCKILDIGSGTGCIPITLCLENEDVYADSVDISFNAIETARKNAIYHNINNRAVFFQSDLFENIKNKYNIIVSNPPYIPIKEKETLQEEVKNYDPALALFAYDDNGIEFYEKIIKQAEKYLFDKGYIIFEVGINQSELVKKIFEENDYIVLNIEKDFNGIERIILAQKK